MAAVSSLLATDAVVVHRLVIVAVVVVVVVVVVLVGVVILNDETIGDQIDAGVRGVSQSETRATGRLVVNISVRLLRMVVA